MNVTNVCAPEKNVAVLPSGVHSATNTVPLLGGSCAAGLTATWATYAIVADCGTVNCAVALPGSSVSTPLTLRYSARRARPSPVGKTPVTDELATTTPMDDTAAPSASTSGGVSSGTSWMAF